MLVATDHFETGTTWDHSDQDYAHNIVQVSNIVLYMVRAMPLHMQLRLWQRQDDPVGYSQ